MTDQVTESNLWEAQVSTPIERTDPKTGDVTWTRRPSYTNKRVHVIAPTMERAIEIVRQQIHPEARFHQVIKRNDMNSVYVDQAVVVAIVPPVTS